MHDARMRMFESAAHLERFGDGALPQYDKHELTRARLPASRVDICRAFSLAVLAPCPCLYVLIFSSRLETNITFIILR